MTTATAGKCKFQQHRSSNRTLTQFKAFCLLKQTLILTFHRVSKRNELFYTGSLWRSKDFTFCLSLTKIVLNFLLFYFCRFFFISFIFYHLILFISTSSPSFKQSKHACMHASTLVHTHMHAQACAPSHACMHKQHAHMYKHTPLQFKYIRQDCHQLTFIDLTNIHKHFNSYLIPFLHCFMSVSLLFN